MTDIMKKLSAEFTRMFSKAEPASEPQAEDWPPPHLRELVARDVERIARRIRTEFAAGLPYTLELELSAWLETHTVHDGRRVATALRHYGMGGLAQEIEGLLSDEVAER